MSPHADPGLGWEQHEAKPPLRVAEEVGNGPGKLPCQLQEQPTATQSRETWWFRETWWLQFLLIDFGASSVAAKPDVSEAGMTICHICRKLH